MIGRPFKKGQSGNPGGRPKVVAEIRQLARESVAGRPTQFTSELAEQIVELVTDGLSIREIAETDGIPVDKRTIRRWLANDEQFCHKYLEAKQIAMIWMAEDLVDIADDTENDTHTTKYGDGREIESANVEWISRSRVRIDTRKWIMARLAPKLFGDKIVQQHTGADGGPLTISWKKADEE